MIAEGTGVAPLRVGIVEVSCGAGVAVEVDSTLAKVVVIVATERGVAEVAAVVIGAAEVEYGAAPVVVVARVARLVVRMDGVVDVLVAFFEAAIVVVD